MEAEAVLEVMAAFFAKRDPRVTAATLREKQITALLPDSLDIEEFLMHLEEGLNPQRALDMNQFGPSNMEMTFGDLAKDVARFLSEGAAA
jgi:hypothetical protein